MSENVPRPPRSGCAVLTGVFLIVFGTLALGFTVGGAAFFVRTAKPVVTWYGTYWPLLLILWGTYKVFSRLAHPGRATFFGGEVVLLVWIVVTGLAIRGAERAMAAHSMELTWDDLAGLVGPDLLGPAHYFTKTQHFDADGLRSLAVESERGEIAIRGWDEDEVEVIVTKRVHDLSKEEAERIASAVSVRFERTGERARLATVRGRRSGPVFVDLELRVPRALGLKVRHEKGPVRLDDVEGAVEVSTTHASIEAESLSGGIVASTTHAPIRLRQIRGRAEARTRHGSITARNIQGDLEAETQNASITAETIAGAATLKTRHARVHAKDIGGHLTIEAHHTKVDVERVAGSVKITTSARPVYVSGVEGALDLRTNNSSTVVRDVGGRVTIETQFRRVSVTNVAGDVKVTSEQCAIDVDSVAGDIDIEGTDEDIQVKGFASNLDVRGRHAPVSVSTKRLSGAVRIETSYADVTLSLPADLSARFTARTKDGEVRSAFPTSARKDADSDSRWEAIFGTGTYPLSVETSYGDIVLEKEES